LCEKFGAIALVLLSFMAGRLAGWLAGKPADKIVLNLEIFKIIYWMKYSTFCYVYQRYSVIIVVPMHFSGFFCVKTTLRWIFDMPKFRMPFFWINLEL